MPPDLMRARCEGLQASNANLEFLNHEILFDRTARRSTSPIEKCNKQSPPGAA
jgi:hypothetical protein